MIKFTPMPIVSLFTRPHNNQMSQFQLSYILERMLGLLLPAHAPHRICASVITHLLQMVHINCVAKNGRLQGDGLQGMTVLWMLLLKMPRELYFMRLLTMRCLGQCNLIRTMGIMRTV